MAVKPVLVIGSVNYDLIVEQHRLPRRGETLHASSFRGAFGGKGANQAVQAARLGAGVQFIGAVGADHYGSASLANFRAEGIDCRMRPTELGTGLGFVHVVGDGEVYATIHDGANADVSAEWVQENRSLVASAGIVIIQNEIPAEANAAAVEAASAAGVPVIYNAAPARAVSTRMTRSCAWFVVNEDEAASYLERDLGDVGDDTVVRQVAEDLRAFCDNVILTLGSRGCCVATEARFERIRAIPAKAVDTTGAGDSFIGAFATAIMEGADPFLAARDATRVAAITVESAGAQSSMPTREDLIR